MRLPGTEEWSSDAVSQRIAFERNVAEGVRFLLRETARSDNLVNFEEADQFFASDAIFAFGRAAELAFATDNFQLGTDICWELLNHELARPKTPMQFAFFATVGALLGAFRISLTPTGVEVLPDDRARPIKAERIQFAAWTSDSSVDAVRLIQHLLPAAAVSNLAKEAASLFRREADSVLKPSIVNGVTASTEYQLLLSLVDSRSRDQPIDFSDMDLDYSQRLATLRSDGFYWNSLRPRGTIIDWSLLAFRAAAIKMGGRRLNPIRTKEAMFIERLATDFASYAANRFQ